MIIILQVYDRNKAQIDANTLGYFSFGSRLESSLRQVVTQTEIWSETFNGQSHLGEANWLHGAAQLLVEVGLGCLRVVVQMQVGLTDEGPI